MRTSFFAYALTIGFAAMEGSALALPLPLGTYAAQSANISNCGAATSVPITRCLKVTVTCPGVVDMFAYLRISDPPAGSLGVVTFFSGAGGTGMYETAFGVAATNEIFAKLVIDQKTPVQVGWNNQIANGWLTGPGGQLALACRTATMLDAVEREIRIAGTPFCATGNSGGSQAIADPLGWYGLGSKLDYAVLSSGPPLASLARGCLGYYHKGDTYGDSWAAQCKVLMAGTFPTCAHDTVGWTLTDASYGGGTVCQTAIANGVVTNAQVQLWDNDSLIESKRTEWDYPQTPIAIVLGGNATGIAEALGKLYHGMVRSSKSITVVPGATHNCPNSTACAAQIYALLQSQCILRH